MEFVFEVSLDLFSFEDSFVEIFFFFPVLKSVSYQPPPFNLKDGAESKFGFLLKALSSGCPPHGGIAFGLDRIVMLVTDTTNIRDVIAFPKTQSAACLLTDAPSKVEKDQLDELKIISTFKEE